MNQAIRTFRPSSSWISAALLTLFVVSFGLFAESHSEREAAQPEVVGSFCATEASPAKTKTVFRYY